MGVDSSRKTLIHFAVANVTMIKSSEQFAEILSVKENLVFVNFGYAQCDLCRQTNRQWNKFAKGQVALNCCSKKFTICVLDMYFIYCKDHLLLQ